MWRYIAIDPGNTQSGVVYTNEPLPGSQHVVTGENMPNDALREFLQSARLSAIRHELQDYLCVEYMVPRGMPTAAEEMDTMYELGRMVSAYYGTDSDERVIKIPRHRVKSEICASPRAKDSNIRQALIDMYGGQDVAIGGKKCPKCKGKRTVGKKQTPCTECTDGWRLPPGPLHGITKHAWQALGVLVVAMKQNGHFG